MDECQKNLQSIENRLSTLRLSECVGITKGESSGLSFLREAFLSPGRNIAILVVFVTYLFDVWKTLNKEGNEGEWLTILQSRLESEEQQLQSISEDFQGLETELKEMQEAMEARLTVIATNIQSVDSAIMGLESEETERRHEVVNLERQLVQARLQLSEVQTRRLDLEAERSALEEQAAATREESSVETERKRAVLNSLGNLASELEEAVTETRKTVEEISKEGSASAQSLEADLRKQMEALKELYTTKLHPQASAADFERFVDVEIVRRLQDLDDATAGLLENLKTHACQPIMSILCDENREELLQLVESASELHPSPNVLAALIRISEKAHSLVQSFVGREGDLSAEEASLSRRHSKLQNETLPSLEDEQKELIKKKLYRQAAQKATEIEAAHKEHEVITRRLQLVQDRQKRLAKATEVLEDVCQRSDSLRCTVVEQYASAEMDLRQAIRRELQDRSHPVEKLVGVEPGPLEPLLTTPYLQWLGEASLKDARNLNIESPGSDPSSQPAVGSQATDDGSARTN
eukprot:Protomagalhaensia_sp_Gyna_25__233@NODE_1109_length_2180_cov_4_870154_g878_i0_p1_GENE_NODE_1109_length_2180_cov_4_870154_g878_i0NODE_1109_length_2180_cov_4_870154_g878_i0_p1_ORF_typecomplete_len548_score101_43DUF948/PF06103_11/9_2DUF948/PF06103_11/0_035DUF948/PF06103_11/7_7e02Exonuc_V_gamma/PF04257_14/0_0074Exonuc_V_gamma/PF04257_14/1_5e03Exonuc_V_gamma/PF04257_14/1_7e03YnfE/PF17452_2/8e03YnfE/PF17452_2/82YnfE/PF17452_2/2YnfE/PF17452_2/7_1e03DUF1542/PF07564_11/2e03DUF1542/PF07564_11/0_17Baculo_PE